MNSPNHLKATGSPSEEIVTPASAIAARRLAAQVYDQDAHSKADLTFLEAIWVADRQWIAQLDAANLQFGGGSEAWQAVKNLATRQRDADYARALAVFEAAGLPEENIREIDLQSIRFDHKRDLRKNFEAAE